MTMKLNATYFRVWDKETGVFSRISPFAYLPKNDEHPHYFIVEPAQDGMIVEQSIPGVLDITGKPIFPGDYVHRLWKGSYTGCFQVHKKKCGEIVLRMINTQTAFVIDFVPQEVYTYQVMGNIHEDQEMEYYNKGIGKHACV